LSKINNVSHKMVADIEKNTEYFKKAKKEWNYFGEVLSGEKQKLIEQINGLQNKTNELEEQLETEKAKSWWKKLKETIQGRFYLSMSDLPPKN
jgi:predicted nuclease with TOPRIM domain